MADATVVGEDRWVVRAMNKHIPPDLHVVPHKSSIVAFVFYVEKHEAGRYQVLRAGTIEPDKVPILRSKAVLICECTVALDAYWIATALAQAMSVRYGVGSVDIPPDVEAEEEAAKKAFFARLENCQTLLAECQLALLPVTVQ